MNKEHPNFQHSIPYKYDVVLDTVGEPTFNSSLRSLSYGGKLIIIGNINTKNVNLNLGYIIFKEIQLIGSNRANKQELIKVLNYVKEKKLKPIIYKELSLNQYQIAYDILKRKEQFGRVLLINSKL